MNKEFFGKEYVFESVSECNNAVAVSSHCDNVLEFEKCLGDYLIEFEVV